MLNSPQCAHCYSHTCWYLKKKGLAFALSSKSVNILSTTLTVFRGFPGGSNGKEFACNAGDLGLLPGLGRYPGERNNYPIQYSVGEFHVYVYSPQDGKELDPTEQHSLSL